MFGLCNISCNQLLKGEPFLSLDKTISLLNLTSCNLENIYDSTMTKV